MVDELLRALAPGWSVSISVLVVSIIVDLVFPEPPNRLHPVVWIGKLITTMQRYLHVGGSRTQLISGSLIALAVVSVSGASALIISALLLMTNSVLYVIASAFLLKTCFSVRGLERAAKETKYQLESGNLAEARQSLRDLVSRDASQLDEGQVAAAAIESVAENSTDSYVGPWLFFAVGSVPAAFVYRATNTLDSMIGYRGEFEYSGKFAARLDDILNFIPARLSALLILAAGTTMRLWLKSGLLSLWHERVRTASPNAGWTMSATSGLLQVRLEKTNHYVLGKEYPPPGPHHIGLTISIHRDVALLGAIATISLISFREISW